MNGHRPHEWEHSTGISRTGEFVYHYTCNAPSKDVLDRNGIKYIGDDFRCSDPREIVKIPMDLYLKSGFVLPKDLNSNILQIISEQLMRDL